MHFLGSMKGFIIIIFIAIISVIILPSIALYSGTTHQLKIYVYDAATTYSVDVHEHWKPKA